MFTMRFDMRAPAFGAPRAELYRAALEMASWAEENGCVGLQVCEHHRSSDGYLPAPLILASALAARTKKIGVQVAALIVPLHDPVELAEQMAVLDLVSGGRVAYVLAIGYVPAEYAMFGQEMKGRGKRLEESIDVMKRLWAGEEFDYQGRRVKVTPPPHTPGGPVMMLGGGVPATARRAAKLGLGVLARPLVWLLTKSSNVVLMLFGDSTSFTESRLSSDELKAMLEEAGQAGRRQAQLDLGARRVGGCNRFRALAAPAVLAASRPARPWRLSCGDRGFVGCGSGCGGRRRSRRCARGVRCGSRPRWWWAGDRE